MHELATHTHTHAHIIILQAVVVCCCVSICFETMANNRHDATPHACGRAEPKALHQNCMYNSAPNVPALTPQIPACTAACKAYGTQNLHVLQCAQGPKLSLTNRPQSEDVTPTAMICVPTDDSCHTKLPNKKTQIMPTAMISTQKQIH